MGELMQDPVFYWLMWAVFTIAGTIIGWTLRANTSEKEVRMVLARIEQEKNTLARLYTHIKHQHDLREADFRRASLELTNLHAQVQWLENERISLMPDAEVARARIEKAEYSASQYSQKAATLEMLAESLRSKNDELNAQLDRAKQELMAWETIYRDFKTMQQRLFSFETEAKSIALERDDLKNALADARKEILNLQLELAKMTRLAEKQSNSRTTKRGGPAAPEAFDDLKAIRGITALVEQKLWSLGISTYAQIGSWDDDAVISFARALGTNPGKLFQEDWVGQAKLLAREKG
jgi:predicted flap endonuclease-1-like 5' DNA nuclease